VGLTVKSLDAIERVYVCTYRGTDSRIVPDWKILTTAGVVNQRRQIMWGIGESGSCIRLILSRVDTEYIPFYTGTQDSVITSIHSLL
jgi:hypothetical protein